MERHRIGIIGVGKIARDRHIPAIAANPAFELVALSNVAGEPPAGASRVFDGYAELLADPAGPETVAICTPPAVRHEIAHAALLAGKHVLLEKPPAATPGEVRDLAWLAEQSGRVLFTAYHSHFNAAVDAAKQHLNGRTIAHLRVTWKEDVRKWHPGQEWIWRRGGFGVFDPGINALSIVTKILPRPVFVRDAALLFASGAETPIAAKLDLGSGGAAELWQADFDWRPIETDVREIAVTTGEGTHLRLSASGGCLEIDGVATVARERTEYPDMYRHFDTLLRERKSDVDVRPLDLVAEAFLAGRRIEL